MRNTFAVASPVVVAVAAVIAGVGVGGCARAPDAVTVDGHALKKATAAALANGLERVAYSADGDEGKLRAAHDVLTVTWSDTGSPEDTLAQWVQTATSGMSVEKWYAETSGTTSCRATRNLQSGRFAVAVTECAKVKKHNACADYEEVFDVPCSVNDEACRVPRSKALCDGRAEKLSADLDAAMKKVAH